MHTVPSSDVAMCAMFKDMAVWTMVSKDRPHVPKEQKGPLLDTVRATLECRGGYTVTWADRGENQSMNNQSKYNKGDLT